MVEMTELGRVCGPVGRGECYRQTYNEQSDTGGAVLGRGHAGSWASCAETVRGSLECWKLESCSVGMHLEESRMHKRSIKICSISEE